MNVLFLFLLVLGAAALIVWIWALVDAIGVPDDAMYQTGNKLVCVLVIALTGTVGAIIYLAAGRPMRGAAAPPAAPPPPPPPPPY